jgi:hypothetical protein
MIVAVDILAMVYLIPYNSSSLFYAFFTFRDVFAIFVFLYQMHRLFPLIWTKSIVLIISFLLVICIDIGTICALSIPYNIQYFLGNYIAVALKSLAFLLLFVQYIKWFIYVFNTTHTTAMKSRIHLCTLYAISVFIFLCFEWSVFFAPPGSISTEWSSVIGVNYFTMYNYIIAGTTITLTIVTLRLARLETTESQVK